MKIKTRKSKLWGWFFREFLPGAKPEETWLTFGKTIWTPGGITADLIIHEQVHISQQKNCIRAVWWWIKYLRDPEFRYLQEVPAYRAQYQFIAGGTKDRNLKFKIRCDIAKIMASEQYGKMVGFNRAMQDLEK